MSYVHKSWCVTIRPVAGICDARIALYKKWALRQAGAYGVLEGLGETRHLHLQLFFEEPRSKGDVNKAIQRIFERLETQPNEIRVLRRGTRIAYNLDFIETYLQKEEGREVVVDNVPEKPDDYFPTDEEQERVKRVSTAVDAYMAGLNEKLLVFLQDKYHTDMVFEAGVRHFLGDAMYCSRTMRVIRDPRILQSTVTALTRYGSKDEYALCDDKQWEYLELLKKSLREDDDSGY